MGWGAYWLRDNFGLKFWFGPTSAAFSPPVCCGYRQHCPVLFLLLLYLLFCNFPMALSLFFDVIIIIIASSFVYCVLLWC